jgi:hypothetical protein
MAKVKTGEMSEDDFVLNTTLILQGRSSGRPRSATRRSPRRLRTLETEVAFSASILTTGDFLT